MHFVTLLAINVKYSITRKITNIEHHFQTFIRGVKEAGSREKTEARKNTKADVGKTVVRYILKYIFQTRLDLVRLVTIWQL